MKKGAGSGKRAEVGIIMGSPNDLPVMDEAAKILDRFGVSYEMTVTSAHRSPDRTHRFVKSAEANGMELLIVGAGGAAHLAGTREPARRRPLTR